MVVAAALAAGGAYLLNRGSGGKATASTTTLSAQNVVLRGLIPPSIVPHCLFHPQPEAHPGNLATADCPYTDSKHGVLTRLHIDHLRDVASVNAVYVHHAFPALHAAGMTPTFKGAVGRCDRTHLPGEMTWSHDMGVPGAPIAGRFACYTDPKTNEPTITWTYPPQRLFMLVSGPSHGELYAWWSYWAHAFG